MTEVVGMAKLRTLGGLTLEPVGFRQPKPLVLLTYLALEGPQRRKALAALFWPDGNGQKSLSMALSRLRQAAPGCCETEGDRAMAQVVCDAGELLEALAEADVGRAVELYRGAFLDGVEAAGSSAELEEWIVGKREELAGRLRALLIGRAESLAAAGQDDEAAGVAAAAWRLVGAAPPEPAEGRRLYALLSAAAHPAAAEVLEDLQTLEPEAYAPGAATSEMGSPGSTFVGREQELAAIAAHLERPGCRLITVVGPGGIGKTRLALQMARAAKTWGSFPDGVHVARLEALNDPAQLPALLAQALAAPQRSAKDGWQHLSDVVADRRVLLVLDNAEHLLAAAPRLAELLDSSSGLKLLVTSRERLGLDREQVLSLAGLPWPAAGSRWTDAVDWPAVRLLRERVTALHAGLDLQAQAAGVIELCASLGGLPLGLEMAAGLLRIMTAHELSRLVARDPGALGSVPATGSRHGSLGAVMETSWQRLPEASQLALARLSAFSGGFGPESALAVAQVAAPMLDSLVDASWLQRSGDGRFDLHPYVHAFARGRLAEIPDQALSVTSAHADWHLALAREAAQVTAARRKERFLVLAREQANLLAALDHYASTAPESGLELAALLSDFWLIHGHYAEGLDQLLRALRGVESQGLPAGLRTAWVRALVGAGRIAWRKGERERARACFRQALEETDVPSRPGDPQGPTRADAGPSEAALRADALLGLGLVVQDLDGDFGGAAELYHAGLQGARLSGDPIVIAEALRILGTLDGARGDYASARRRLREALALAETAGDDLAVAKGCINLASVLADMGEAAQARPLNERALTILRAIGDRHGQAVVLINLGVAASNRGEEDEALRLYHLSLALFRQLGERRSVCHLLNNIAGVHQTLGEPDAARPLLEESLERLRTLGEPALTTHALYLYGKVLMDLGEREAAKRQLDACIELSSRNDERWAWMRALVAMAKWHDAANEHDKAAALAHEAERMAEAAGDAGILRSARAITSELLTSR